MQLNIPIPDAVGPRVLNAIAARYGYTGPDTLLDKKQFVEMHYRGVIRDEVLEHEQAVAAAAARAAVAGLEV